MTDDLIARQSFAARNAALEHYKKSAEQLHNGERPMCPLRTTNQF